MEALRRIRNRDGSAPALCSRCGADGCPWDRLADQPMCPDCQEALALGEGPMLRQRGERRACAVCGRSGTLRYLTYPLHSAEPVEMDLCGAHCEALLARRLERSAFRRLELLLQAAGVEAKEIFLLHEAFYDRQGRPLQPIREAW
ncbi:MAG TPA: hypothetical protein VMS17_24545 [Gemmataceae bacterium]|nr:hypothetical protein [Gemmataceae bacterium]